LTIPTSNLTKRIRKFYQAYTGKSSLHHSAGDRLFLIWACQHSFTKHNKEKTILQYTIKPLDNKEAAVNEEERLLWRYFIKYGELPPLNANMPYGNNWKDLVMGAFNKSSKAKL
jgi:hypothetical protein